MGIQKVEFNCFDGRYIRVKVIYCVGDSTDSFVKTNKFDKYYSMSKIVEQFIESDKFLEWE